MDEERKIAFWLTALVTFICGAVCGITLGFTLSGRVDHGLPDKCTTNTMCLVTNDVGDLRTNRVLWTGLNPVLSGWTTNGLQTVPAIGYELGLRDDGCMVWRLVNRPVSQPVTVYSNVVCMASNTITPVTNSVSATNRPPRKLKRLFSW